MGLVERHTYRFGYLKSEKWLNLRLKKLAEADARCFYCDYRDLSNDVHHVYYAPSLNDTTTKDLRVLCREHHTRLHELMEAEIAKNPPTDHIKSNKSFRIFRVCSMKIESEMHGKKRKCYTRNAVRIRGITKPVDSSAPDPKIRSIEKLNAIFSLLCNLKKDVGLKDIPYLLNKVEFASQAVALIVGEVKSMQHKAIAEAEEKKVADFIQNNFIDGTDQPIIHDDSRAG